MLAIYSVIEENDMTHDLLKIVHSRFSVNATG